MILRPDGSEVFETARQGVSQTPSGMGADAGRELKAKGGPDFFTGG